MKVYTGQKYFHIVTGTEYIYLGRNLDDITLYNTRTHANQVFNVQSFNKIFLTRKKTLQRAFEEFEIKLFKKFKRKEQAKNLLVT